MSMNWSPRRLSLIGLALTILGYVVYVLGTFAQIGLLSVGGTIVGICGLILLAVATALTMRRG
jgi:hypothetical protein